MSEYLFAYSTILTGELPADIARIVTGLNQVGTGSVRGFLYNLGPYPGIRLDDSANHVRGVIFELQSPLEVFDALDEYEGFDRTNPARSLFIRVRCLVMMDSGGSLESLIESWIYEYHQNLDKALLLASGDYVSWRAGRE